MEAETTLRFRYPFVGRPKNGFTSGQCAKGVRHEVRESTASGDVPFQDIGVDGNWCLDRSRWVSDSAAVPIGWIDDSCDQEQPLPGTLRR